MTIKVETLHAPHGTPLVPLRAGEPHTCPKCFRVLDTLFQLNHHMRESHSGFPLAK